MPSSERAVNTAKVHRMKQIETFEGRPADERLINLDPD